MSPTCCAGGTKQQMPHVEGSVSATATQLGPHSNSALGDGEAEGRLAWEPGPWTLGKGSRGVGTAHPKAKNLWIPGSPCGSLHVMFLGRENEDKVGETDWSRPGCGSSDRWAPLCSLQVTSSDP